MALTPRNKALVFAASLVLVSTVLVGSAVATTNSALQPFLRGDGFAKERSLTRGESVSLAVLVSQSSEGQLQGVHGATVRILRNQSSEAVAEKQTGAQGAAVFELKRGSYTVHINSTAGEAERHIGLGHSQRLAVVFDAEGAAHWQKVDHKQLEKRGEHKHLLVRVGEARSGERPEPVEGAKVSILRIEDDNSTVLVSEQTTGPRGFVDVALPKGRYVIRVETDNASGEHRVRLQGNLAVGAVVDGEKIEWRSDRPDAQDFGRPSSRPRGGPR